MDKKCDITKIDRKWKEGDIHPKTGRVFGHYTGYHKSGEQWYSKEVYEKRKKHRKEYNKSEEFKAYQKQWYASNKTKVLKKTAANYKYKKQTSPLAFIYRNAEQSLKTRKKKGKNIDFDITIQFLNDLWEQQNGKCFYTNVPMVIIKEGKHPQHPSLDRKDSDKGYTKNNVVLCCQSINFAKSCYTEAEFIDFLKLVKSL